MRAALALGLLAGCAAPPGEVAKAWTVRDFLGAGDKRFGDVPAGLLGAAEGEGIEFRRPPYQPASALQQRGFGLTVFPAYAAGQVAAFTVTEVWSHHPAPWVQPVWVLVSQFHPEAPGAYRLPLGAAEKVPNVFAVGEDSTFYSPYWQLHFVEVGADAVASDAFTSAKAVLDRKLPTHAGPLVLCPIVLDGVSLARAAGEAVVHPFTGAQILDHGGPFERPLATAWLDGAQVRYLDFGPERFSREASGELRPTALYAFASRAHPEKLLAIPPVLADDAWDHAFMELSLVSLPAAAQPFVPADRPELAAMLEAEGFAPPAADPAIPPEVARAYQLRVASDASCFTEAGRFPGGCAWLDSEAAVRRAGAAVGLAETATTLSVAVLAVEGGF